MGRARGIEHRRIRNPAPQSRMGGGRARRRAADSRFEGDPTMDRRQGCRMLRFLGTDLAVDEMIKRYGDSQWGCEFEFTAGLFSARDRERVVRLLGGWASGGRPASQRGLSSNIGGPVGVRRSIRSCGRLETRDTKGRLIPSTELDRLTDLVKAARATYTEILDAALPEKSARARAMILSWRVESGRRPDPGFSTRRQRRAIVCANNSLRRSSSCRPNGRPRCSSISGPLSPARPWCPYCGRSSTRRRPPRLFRILR